MLLDIIPGDTLSKADISASTFDKLMEQLLDHAITIGLKLIAVAIVFIVGRWVIGWLRKLINKFLDRRSIENTVKSFLDSLANITLQTILFLLIVNILGISLTSFAAILAAAGLAVGMAMKDNLSNFAGGVMLLINKPFKVGNRIVAQGMDGTVQSIGILYTVLLTGDNRSIYIPNGPLSTGTITNYSDQDKRRIDLTLNIGYGIDVDNTKAILQSIIKNNKLIKDSPAPFIGVTMINNGSMDLTIRVWGESSDYANINIDLNEKIYAAFREKGIYSPSLLNVKMIKD